MPGCGPVQPDFRDPDATGTFRCLPSISFVVGDLFAGSPDETL